MMYNDNDYEVSDLDEDIERRKALLEEVKQIPESSDWNSVFREILDLQKKWKRIPYWESAYEDQLTEEFEAYVDTFYKKRNAGYQGNQQMKQELIKQAVVLASRNDFRQATEEMNDLMAQWKAIGSTGKEMDDTLWAAFNEARQSFFDHKHDHWEDMQKSFANAKVVKQEIIKQAKLLEDSEEWQTTSNQFREWMKQWTAAGSAGKEHEDTLWKEFNGIRQQFYERREQHYAQIHDQLEQNYEAKSALVKQANTIALSKEYSRENTNQMSQLSIEWKKIGSCDREKENQIWREFRSNMDDYFAGLRAMNEQKHREWLQRMNDIRNRKLDLIQKQKRQIQYLKEEMVGLLGQKAIDDVLEDIEDKKQFILELEAELVELDQKISSEK